MSKRAIDKSSTAFKLLAGTVGIGMATTLMLDTRQDEGDRPRAYQDIGGVWTICSGTTRGVKPGEVDTAEQCDARTAADLVIAVKGVERCAPGLKAPARHEQLRAAVRFNNNTGKFCSGSVGRLMRAYQWRAGCDAMLRYVYVKGRMIRGLRLRREREHAICVSTLPRPASAPLPIKAKSPITTVPRTLAPIDFPLCVTVKPGPIVNRRKVTLYPNNSESV